VSLLRVALSIADVIALSGR